MSRKYKFCARVWRYGPIVRKRWRRATNGGDKTHDGSNNSNKGPGDASDDSQSGFDEDHGEFPGHDVAGNIVMEYVGVEDNSLKQLVEEVEDV